jgi:hypothetical protein
MRRLQHQNLGDAIREAEQRAPAAVGWMPGGWFFYFLTEGCPEGAEPELLVLKRGVPPIPLSETGRESLMSLWGVS